MLLRCFYGQTYGDEVIISFAFLFYHSKCAYTLTVIIQAHAPPPGYIVRIKNRSTKGDFCLRKIISMRRWLCCTCQVEESDQAKHNELLKSPKNNADGMFLWPLLSCIVALELKTLFLFIYDFSFNILDASARDDIL